MQIKKIKLNTSTGRVEFYNKEGLLEATVPCTSAMLVKNETVSFAAGTEKMISLGYSKDFTTTQIDTNPEAPAPNTFVAFLALLNTTFFNATNAGGGGGGTAGGATAAKQDEQTVSLQSIQTSSSLTRFYTDRTRQDTGVIVQTIGAISAGVGIPTDPAITDPLIDGSQIGILKGILTHTKPAPTPSTHFRNSSTTNSVLVKAGAGKILRGTCTNRTTGTKHFRFYNTNTTPNPASTPIFEVSVTTGTTVELPTIEGFTLGIAYIISTSTNIGGAQLTVADACSVSLSYY